METGGTSNGALERMPQLDSLRAFAISAVLFAHFSGALGESAAGAGLDAGAAGVRLFFVLSGFLITGILLKARGRAAPPVPRDPREILWRFYARRALRIFPLYYLVLLAGFCAGLPEVRESIGWHAAYLAGFAGRTRGATSHFWSLGVEELFYLVWPWCVLYMPPGRLRPALLGAILVFSAASYFINDRVAAKSVGSFAVLALGCLSALQYPFGSAAAGAPSRARGFPLVAAALLLLSSPPALWWASETVRDAADIVSGLGQGVIFAWLVTAAAAGVRGTPGRLLDSAPLRYLGKISYGLYVYHLFVPGMLRRGMSLLHDGVPASFGPGLHVGATVVCAALSWHLFERRFCELKSRFD